MPTYEFQCEQCKHEWEEYLSIKAPNPEKCPKCEVSDKVLRLISGGSGRGVVPLTGQDLSDKISADAAKLQRDAAKDERVYSNLMGESKYQQLQTQMDRRRR